MTSVAVVLFSLTTSILSGGIREVLPRLPIWAQDQQSLLSSSKWRSGESRTYSQGIVREEQRSSPCTAELPRNPNPRRKYSPSELLMSRTLRTTIPTTRTQRVPRVPDREEVRTRDQRMKQRQKKNFDSHHGARTLPVLKTGDRVWIPTRQKEGTVQSGVAPRSLLVSTEDGSELRRNRKDIIELPQPNVGEQETQTEREQWESSQKQAMHNLLSKLLCSVRGFDY